MNTTITQKIDGNLNTLIVRAVQEVLEDHDFGLELSEKAKKRLKKVGGYSNKTISLEEIKRKYY